MSYKLPLLKESLIPITTQDLINIGAIPSIDPTKKVAIVIDSFLRDKCLLILLKSIFQFAPHYKIYITDQGIYSKEKDALFCLLRVAGHTIINCGFDAGLGQCHKKIVEFVTEPYLFFCHEDSLFTYKTNLESMVNIIKLNRYRISWLSPSTPLFDNPSHLLLKNLNLTITPLEEEFKNSPRAPFICDYAGNQGLVKLTLFSAIQYDSQFKMDETLDLMLNMKFNTVNRAAITNQSILWHQEPCENPIYLLYKHREWYYNQLLRTKWQFVSINGEKIKRDNTKFLYVMDTNKRGVKI
jgi:hypothetical protein